MDMSFHCPWFSLWNQSFGLLISLRVVEADYSLVHSHYVVQVVHVVVADVSDEHVSYPDFLKFLNIEENLRQPSCRLFR